MSLRKVKEASYLTAENHVRYRMILRYFYIQHERMREFMFPEEVFTYLKEQEGFLDYQEDTLHQDLDQLVKWGNLKPTQEMGHSKTIEEYKKKRFRYQPSPYTIEFERMLIEMENKEESFGGALERTQFTRLYQLLQEVEDIVFQNKVVSDEETSQLWEDIQTYFRQIAKNTSDYIAYINSEEVEERMKTEAFLTYKDQFTKYLREFIRAMQSTSEQIRELLKSLSTAEMTRFFEQVWRHKSQARFEDVDVTEETKPFDEYSGKWEAIQSWFRGNHSFGASESDMLLERTTEAIRKITQVVQRMGERNQNFRSRREDYIHLSKWFNDIEDIDDAHILFAAAFGVSHTRHYYMTQYPSDDIYTDTWDLNPVIHETKPMIRAYREKSSPGAVIDRSEKRQDTRNKYLEEKRQERQWIDKYINDHRIDLDKIEKIEPNVRQIFLSWLGKAMGKDDQTIQTDIGMRVKVIRHTNRIILHSDDGDLEMPNVSFIIMKDKGEGSDA